MLNVEFKYRPNLFRALVTGCHDENELLRKGLQSEAMEMAEHQV